MVVIGTTRGHIRFYDQDMCLLHWYQQSELDAITSLSFSVDAATAVAAKASASWAASRTSFPTARHSVDAEQRAVQQRMDLSRMISGPLPRGHDAEGAFQARDLIVSTDAGRMVLVSFASERCVVLHDYQVPITAIQTHTDKPQLLIGRADGSISLIDYEKKEVMMTYAFECKPGAEPVAVTSLKYSPNGAVLACGRANGTLYLLHPVLLQPIVPQPFQKTRHAVRHLCFSPDNMFMAHCDSANFVSAYRCHNAAKGRWVYLGKQQLHGLAVRCLLFGPQPFDAPLFSLGEDLLLVEYDVAHSMNNTLVVHRMDPVEQSGVPSHMTWCPGREEGDDLTLLIATSEYKYKLVDLKSRSLCGTYQGPRLRTPVCTIKVDAVPAAGGHCTAGS
ncbi:cilia- and flagella-associated protein 251-like [Thrips palmi]|uniref:Cilia- and flagella-associated protein 251 n=1 Tax=Thrips palmi TaxID=161013 RepID=A0A6P8Z820_THRPL|nr:cilia- and flagella-associated protein 251-like [Thrips palmi]